MTIEKHDDAPYLFHSTEEFQDWIQCLLTAHEGQPDMINQVWGNISTYFKANQGIYSERMYKRLMKTARHSLGFDAADRKEGCQPGE